MNTRRTLPMAVAALVALVGCASEKELQRETPAPPPRAEPPQPPAQQPMGQTMPGQQPMGQMAPEPETAVICPMMDDDVVIDTEETTDGIAVTFTTEQGDVASLRRHVQHMANMVNRTPPAAGQAKRRGMRPGQQPAMRGQGEMRGRGMGMMKGRGWGAMPASARVEEINNGSRLILTPEEPAQVEDLRAQVRQHTNRMGGRCPMLRFAPRAG